jgi:hypothetical protein
VSMSIAKRVKPFLENANPRSDKVRLSLEAAKASVLKVEKQLSAFTRGDDVDPEYNIHKIIDLIDELQGWLK